MQLSVGSRFLNQGLQHTPSASNVFLVIIVYNDAYNEVIRCMTCVFEKNGCMNCRADNEATIKDICRMVDDCL